MASYKSNYLDNLILNWLLNGASLPTISTLYLALFTSRPANDGTGGVEVAGSVGYSRTAITPNTTNFPTTTTESCSNGVAINVGTPSGAGWGNVTSAAIMDAASGGHFLYIGDLTTSITLTVGVPVQFIAGALVVGES